MNDDDSVPNDVVFKLNNLLNLVKYEDIGRVVSEIFKVNIGSLNPAAIKACIQWVIQTTVSVEDKQLLFLCAVLGHIVTNTITIPLPNDESTKHAFDKLLNNLENCFKREFRIPNNCLRLLERSSYTIVQGCSKPGWLTYAAYFRPFFGMQHVLRVKMESCTYSEEDYTKLLPLLVFSVPNIKRVFPEERRLFTPYLKRILQFVPDENVLFKISEKKDHVYRFFFARSDRENFFSDCLKDYLNRRPGTLGDKLKHLTKIPVDFARDMSSLTYGYVQQFINTAAEPSSDEIDAVIDLISTKLSHEIASGLLRNILKSPPAFRHDLLFYLLNDARFTAQWEKVPHHEKVKICTTWVDRKAQSCNESDMRIKETLGGVDILISCSLISSNENLIQNVCENVSKWLRHEDRNRIIEEFKEVENYSNYVQHCIQGLVENALRENPHLLKDKEVIGNLCHTTR